MPFPIRDKIQFLRSLQSRDQIPIHNVEVTRHSDKANIKSSKHPRITINQVIMPAISDACMKVQISKCAKTVVERAINEI